MLALTVLVIVPATLGTACALWAASRALRNAARELREQRMHDEQYRTVRIEYLNADATPQKDRAP